MYALIYILNLHAVRSIEHAQQIKNKANIIKNAKVWWYNAANHGALVACVAAYEALQLFTGATMF